jgi:two-component system LytT family response regulator
MIKAVIIEDSRLARQELKELLKAFPQISIDGEAGSAGEALELIRLLDPELIFLDIHLPGKNGFEILQELDRVPAVIFTTAFDQYALKSFEYNAIDYLLKPIVPERLEQAVAKAEIYLTAAKQFIKKEKLGSNDRIFVKDGNKCWFITIGDIRYFESKGNYTQIHFASNSPLLLKSLQQVAENLDEQQFVRINRQQIINVYFTSTVTELLGSRLKLTLSTGETFQVSRRQVPKIKDIFSL